MSGRELVQWIIGGIVVLATLGIMLVGIWDVNLRYMLVSNLTAPSPAPTLPPLIVTPSSEVAALQHVVETQQAQIVTLTRDLNNFKEDQAKRDVDIRWILDSKLLVAGALGAIVAILGFTTYRSIDDTIREKVRVKLDEQLYQLDPTMVRIHLRRGEGMEKVYERLKLSGLRNLRWFDQFSQANSTGITIVPIANADDEDELVQLVQSDKAETKKLRKASPKIKFDPRRAAFILYTLNNHRVDSTTFEAYANLVTANMVPTVVNMVLVVGRGLNSDLPEYDIDKK